MPDDGILIGFDLGTTSAKGAAFDLRGRLLATAQAGYGIERPQPGFAEQDPAEWWRAFLEVLDELGDTVDVQRVVAVGVCSQVNTHVFVDTDGRPVAPAIVWQDQRCAGVAARLDASLSADDKVRLWGGPFAVDASFLLSRCVWMSESSAAWPSVRWILSPKDYVNFRLTGEIATDVISPIGLVGRDHAYIEDVFALAPEARRLMPPLRPFTHPLGSVQAEEPGLPGGASVVVATMDAWANLYGSGVTLAGEGMEVAGTSEIIGVLSETARPVPGVVTFLPVDGLRLHAGPTQAGGDALRWFADVVGRSIPEVLRDAEGAEPGALGLVFLPHLMGERAPLWDSEARAVFFGLSSDHGRKELARSLLEGVAFSARHLLEEVERAAGRTAPALNCSGGGARSDLWCQIKADVLGRQLRRLDVLQSGVLGAALMAGAGVGVFRDLAEAAAEMVHVERCFDPDRGRGELYDALYDVYRELYPALRPSYARLSALRSREGGETQIDVDSTAEQER
jgi:xylulokinase